MTGKAQTAAQKKSDAALFREYEAATDQDIKELAQSFTCDAVRTLVQIMKGTKTPPGVRRQCAMDILHQGWGRPDSRNDGDVVSKGLTINIIKLSTGVVETIHSDVSIPELVEAVDVAKVIAEQVEITENAGAKT